MDRNFNNWLAGFRDSIADYGYYITTFIKPVKEHSASRAIPTSTILLHKQPLDS